MLGTPLKEKTPGIEFAAGLMERMAREGMSLYLLGAKPGVAKMAGEKLAQAHPGLRIAGTHDGYFHEDAPVVEEIRQSGADAVFVCLGAPKQELWMEKNGRLPVPGCCAAWAAAWIFFPVPRSVHPSSGPITVWSGCTGCAGSPAESAG